MGLSDLSVTELSERLRSREISAVEILKSALQRIQAVDGQPGSIEPADETAHNEDGKSVHAFITLTPERARSQAEAVDRKLAAGEDPGLLAGIPFTVKDIFTVQGVRTTAASRILANFTAPYTATPVARMEAAGGLNLGKVNLDEFTYGSSNEFLGLPALTAQPLGPRQGSGRLVRRQRCFGGGG